MRRTPVQLLVLPVASCLAVWAAPTANAYPSDAQVSAKRRLTSDLSPVMSYDGGRVIACRTAASNGFVDTYWGVRNTRRSDVVKATVKFRSKVFGGDTWDDWDRPFYRTGWVNPGVTRRFAKATAEVPASRHQTKVVLSSRDAGGRKVRVLTWTDLPHC